jgi:5-methylcytosine-specific restriction endonuclease McrA
MTDADFLALMQQKHPRYVWIGRVTHQVRLKGPAWDALRESAWLRDGMKCRECGRAVILEKGDWISVHCAHIKSKGSGGSDLPCNVRSLCLSCHDKEHRGKLTS